MAVLLKGKSSYRKSHHVWGKVHTVKTTIEITNVRKKLLIELMYTNIMRKENYYFINVIVGRSLWYEGTDVH